MPSEVLTVPSSVKFVGNQAFWGNYNIKKLVLPKYHTGQVYDFSGLRGATEYQLPENWTEIPANMFRYWISLTEFEFLPQYTKIGAYAFENTKLTEAIIPDTVKEIGRSAFSGCSQLETVHLPSSLTRIEDFTFCGCNALKSIEIPSSVTFINEYAFFLDDGLESVVIPASVEKMHFRAFECCKALKSITFLNPDIQFLDDEDLFANNSLYSSPSWYFDKLTIYGYEGSTAQALASKPEQPFRFIALLDEPEIPVIINPDPQPEEPEDLPKTITFTNLKPDTLYNFYDLLGEEFTAENLLYISQGISDENGTLTIWYRPKADDTDAQKYVVCAETTTTAPPPVSTIKGDMTGDYIVDISDAVLLARFCAEDREARITRQGVLNADVTGDGNADMDDLTRILQYIARLIKTLDTP